MTNIPWKVGDTYACFTVTRNDRGWGGAYGQSRLPVEWTCNECGTKFVGSEQWMMKRLADHHECGHAPCAYCGTMLLRRKDGTPRQHAANRCPNKTAGHIIVKEFDKNITTKEYQ